MGPSHQRCGSTKPGNGTVSRSTTSVPQRLVQGSGQSGSALPWLTGWYPSWPAVLLMSFCLRPPRVSGSSTSLFWHHYWVPAVKAAKAQGLKKSPRIHDLALDTDGLLPEGPERRCAAHGRHHVSPDDEPRITGISNGCPPHTAGAPIPPARMPPATGYAL